MDAFLRARHLAEPHDVGPHPPLPRVARQIVAVERSPVHIVLAAQAPRRRRTARG